MKLKLILSAVLALVVLSVFAAAATVTISPSTPYTDDSLVATVSGSTASYNFYWYKNGAQYSKTTARQATVPASATEPGQVWKVKAFVPSSGYLPEMYVGESQVTIQDTIVVVVPPQCSDYKDNDYDGLVDMADSGCSSPVDNDEYNPPAPKACEDEIDNDTDGLTDMADPGCTSPTDNDEYNPPAAKNACEDGIDNDGDSLVDLADPGCTSPTDNDETNPVVQPQCNDGLDNDGDSLVDLADPGCTSPTDNDETDPVVPKCKDGIDNDADGLIDMADPGCENPDDNDETDPPAECEIEKVWANGFLLTDTSREIELGETVKLDIRLSCAVESKRELRLVASIYSGEYDDIQADTGLFIVKPGLTYFKTLTLNIPEVLDTKDNKLRLRLIDNQMALKSQYLIYLKEQRHNVVVTDVLANEAKAGSPLFIKVRAENQGYKAEEDIKVTAKFLGMTASTYINELEPFGEDGDTDTANVYMVIPANTADGSYELEVTLSYGKETLTSKKTIKVAGKATITQLDGMTLVTIGKLPTVMVTGEKTEMKIMLVNLADASNAYTIELVGAEWADVTKEQLVAVEAGQTVETKITFMPNEKGDKEITVLVKDGDLVIDEYTTKVKVEGPLRAYVVAIGGIGVLLLLAALFIVIKSVTRKDKEEQEASFY